MIDFNTRNIARFMHGRLLEPTTHDNNYGRAAVQPPEFRPSFYTALCSISSGLQMFYDFHKEMIFFQCYCLNIA